MKKHDYFKKYLEFVRKHNLYPPFYKVDGASSSPEVTVDGKKFLTFSSNNYLGIAGDKEIIRATVEGIEKYGVGSGSTRVLLGSLDVQDEFEKELAEFLRQEDSITFSSGFLANVGVIRNLVDPFPYFQLFKEGEGAIVSDELNHASIIDGIRLSKATRQIFRHKDVNHLEEILKQNKGKRILIITDAIFSMDGDIAPLKEIADLSKKYEAITMIDDAHGVGVLGSGGRGTAEHLGVAKDIDVVMGSFTKAFGSIGGYIACNKVIGDYMRITARSYLFSDPIIPGVVAGLRKALEILKNSDERRKIIFENVTHLKSNLDKMGFSTLGGETSIVPLLVSSEEKAIKFSSMLYEAGVIALCIRRPAVPEGRERIRFSIMATHAKKDINKLLEVCEKVGKSLKMI